MRACGREIRVLALLGVALFSDGCVGGRRNVLQSERRERADAGEEKGFLEDCEVECLACIKNQDEDHQ